MSDEQATLGDGTVTVEEHNGERSCDWSYEDGGACGNSASLRVSIPDGWLYACRVHADHDWLNELERIQNE